MAALQLDMKSADPNRSDEKMKNFLKAKKLKWIKPKPICRSSNKEWYSYLTKSGKKETDSFEVKSAHDKYSRSPVFITNYCRRQLYLKLCGDSSTMILGWEMLITTEQPPVLAEIPGQSAGTWTADSIFYSIPDVKKCYSFLFFVHWLQMKQKQTFFFSFRQNLMVL